ncbi:hypothetical protein [Pontimicrobium sp. MEBiC01747]
MIEDTIDNLFKKVITVFIVIFFLVSFFSHIITFYDLNFPTRLTLVVNLVFELCLFYFVFKLNIEKKTYLYVILLIASFIIGQALLNFKFFKLNALLSEVLEGDVLQINNYLLIFFFSAVFIRIKNKKEIIHKVLEIIKYIVYGNAILVILGFVFNIELFKSYPHTPRFGYMGLFLANTFAQFIYIILITLAYKKFQLNKKYLLEFIFISIVALLLGKKAIALFLGLLMIYHFCFFNRYKLIYRIVTATSLFLIVLFKKEIINQLVEWFPFWKKFDVNKNLLSVLLSLRDIRFENFVAFMESHWTKLNYIFGGVNFPKSRVEMELIDLYMFFGITGLIIYFNLFKSFFRRIPINDVILLLFTLVIASLTGSFLVNVNLVIVYYLLIMSFKEEMNYYSTYAP